MRDQITEADSLEVNQKHTLLKFSAFEEDEKLVMKLSRKVTGEEHTEPVRWLTATSHLSEQDPPGLTKDVQMSKSVWDYSNDSQMLPKERVSKRANRT